MEPPVPQNEVANPRETRRTRLLLAAALGVFVVLALPGALRESQTYDEGDFFAYGYQVLAAGDFTRDWTTNSKMPWNAVQVAPSFLLERAGKGAAWRLVEGHRLPGRRALVLARLVTVLAGVGLCLGLFALTREVAGDAAAAATVCLLALDPNLLAHSRYVTTDVPCAATTVLMVLAALALARSPTLPRAAALGAALGLALLVKFTAVHVVLGLALAFVVSRVLRWRDETAMPARRCAALLLALLATCALVVNLGYGLQGLPGRLPQAPQSRKLALVESVIDGAPLPLATPFFEGLDWVVADEERYQGPQTFLGRLDEVGQGSVLYYPVVLALKLPLPLIALLALSVAGAFGRGPAARPRGPLAAHELIIGLVVLELLVYFVLFFRLQIGIRHLLPALALLLVPAGATLARLATGTPRARLLAGALVAWQAASVLSFAPHLLPYVNELVLDRSLTYRVIADSNVDWGQDRDEALLWVARERARGRFVYLDPPTPVLGTVVVSANAALGLESPGRYAWLADLRPVGTIGYSYLIFEVE